MKFKTYLKTIALPLIGGIIVGIITMNGMEEFKTLTKPILSPPGFLFPIVWTILYTLMGISYGLLVTKNLNTKNEGRIYYLQLIINWLWPIIFFTFKWRLLALIWIIILALLVLKMIISFYKQNKVAGLIQIPYFLWILFATYLNLFFYLLNR